jgi:hypothetical protein
VQTSEGVVALGTPLLELGDTRGWRWWPSCSPPTRCAPARAAGAHRALGRPGVLQGRVRRVEPAAFTKVSALGVEEQRVNVLIDLTSPPEQWQALGDGYRVGVRIVTRSSTRCCGAGERGVPGARGRTGRGMAVFVLDGGRARLAGEARRTQRQRGLAAPLADLPQQAAAGAASSWTSPTGSRTSSSTSNTTCATSPCPPGDWRQFCIQASRIHARALDLNRPLWEIYVIEGLDSIVDLPRGSFALLTKIHHAAIDLDTTTN